MKTILSLLAVALIGLCVLFFVAAIGGTVVWLLWPYTIPHVFPGLVVSNIVVAKIGWWKAVFLTWLCSCLFKGGSYNFKKGKE